MFLVSLPRKRNKKNKMEDHLKMAKSKLSIAIAAACAAVATTQSVQAEEVNLATGPQAAPTTEYRETVSVADTKTVEVGTETVETTTPAIEEARSTQAGLVQQATEAGVANWANETIEVATEEEALKQIETDNQRIQDAIVAAEQAKEEHAKAVEEYNAAVAAMEADTHKEGHLKRPVGQSMQFEQGKNTEAKMEIKVPTMHVDAVKKYITDSGLTENLYVTEEGWLGQGEWIELPESSYATVVYTNVQGANAGKKFSRVDYQYRRLTSEPVIIKVFQDPNRGFNALTLNREAEIELIMTAYDDAGNIVPLTDGVFNLGSLNATEDSKEMARIKDGVLIDIQGSTVQSHGGWGYSATNNNEEVLDVKWDNFDTFERYLGAIAGVNKSEKATILVRSENRGTHWFTVDSNLPVRNLPVYPVLDLGHVCYTPVKLMTTVVKTAEIPGETIKRQKPELVIEYKVPEDFPTAEKPELVLELTPKVSETPVEDNTKPEAEVTVEVAKEVVAVKNQFDTVEEVSKEVQLPQTGTEDSSWMAALSMVFGVVAGYVMGVNKKKED